MHSGSSCRAFFFFFNDTATTEIYTLSLHDALPILGLPELRRRRIAFGEVQHREVRPERAERVAPEEVGERDVLQQRGHEDRKSTRLNSSHSQISYAVFCLKKKTCRSSMLPLSNTRS